MYLNISFCLFKFAIFFDIDQTNFCYLGFFTSVLQRHARVHQVPVDSLMFKYEITERVWVPEDVTHERDLDINRVAFHGASPDDCVRIFGLYLDGAIWEPTSACLQESRMDERFSALPEVKIMPVMVRRPFMPTTDTFLKSRKFYVTIFRGQLLLT